MIIEKMDFEIIEDNKAYDGTKRILSKIIEITTSEVRQEDLEMVGEFCVDEIRNNIQNEGHIVSGDLLSSVGIYGHDENSVTIGSDKEYAYFLEFGRPEVRPKTAKFLHWIDPDTGEDVFALRSSATQPTHVFERGVETGLVKAIEYITRMHHSDLELLK